MRRRRRLATVWSLMGSGALAVVGSVALPGLIHAAPAVPTTYTVTNCSSYGSATTAGDFAYAIKNAASGDTIEFNCASAGTIKLDAADGGPGIIDITYSLTITSVGKPIALSGADKTGIFVVAVNPAAPAPVVFNLSNITLEDGTGESTVGPPAGGAISNISETVNIANDTFANNSSEGGGAILNYGQGTMTITNSTFTGNSVTPNPSYSPSGSGGAILNNGTLLITHSTIVGNKADTTGTQPETGYGGGIFSAGSLTIGATIVAENTAAAAANGPDCVTTVGHSGTITDLGYNLESGTDCFTDPTTMKPYTTTDKQNVTNPKLGTLANNGGPTPTIALLAGSPAIDVIPAPTSVTPAGSATAYTLCTTASADQRGYARPDGTEKTCDIGAYEYADPAAKPQTGLSGAAAAPSQIVTARQAPAQANVPARSGHTAKGQSVPHVVVGGAQQPIGGSFPLTLAVLLGVLCFALMGGGALVLGRTRKVDER